MQASIFLISPLTGWWGIHRIRNVKEQLQQRLLLSEEVGSFHLELCIQVWLRRGTINQWGTPVVCWHVLSILDQYWYWERRPTEFHNPTDKNYNWIDGIHIQHIEMWKGTIPASVVGLWGERTINPAHQLIFYQYQPFVGPATWVEQNSWSQDPDLPHNRIGKISSALSLSKILKLRPHMNWILTCRTVFLGSVILQLQSDVE